MCSCRTFRKEGTSCQKNVFVGDTYADLRDCSPGKLAENNADGQMNCPDSLRVIIGAPTFCIKILDLM